MVVYVLVVKVVETLVGAKFVALKLVAVKVVAKKAVEVAFVLVELVNTPVLGVVAPIGVELMVPPLMVKPSTTNASVILLLGRDKVESTVKLFVESAVEEAYVLLA